MLARVSLASFVVVQVQFSMKTLRPTVPPIVGCPFVVTVACLLNSYPATTVSRTAHCYKKVKSKEYLKIMELFAFYIYIHACVLLKLERVWTTKQIVYQFLYYMSLH
jgi:hypothetical protein